MTIVRQLHDNHYLIPGSKAMTSGFWTRTQKNEIFRGSFLEAWCAGKLPRVACNPLKNAGLFVEVFHIITSGPGITQFGEMILRLEDSVAS